MSSESNQGVMTKSLKTIVTIAIVVIVAVGGYFGYQEWITKPKNEKAAAAMMEMERFFQNGQYEEAVNGDGLNQGALSIISQYGSTKSGNLAHYYAGMSFLQLGEYQQAIKHLDQYNAASGTTLQVLAEGAKGDAHLELGEKDKAIASYRKAAEYKDQIASPLFLYRVAMLLEAKDQNDEAVKYLLQIKEEYPESPQALEVEKYLAYLGFVE